MNNLKDKTTGQFIVKHGMSRTPTHNSWRQMKSRCLDPNSNGYKYWGGRGIKVCKRWLEFENFLQDMGVRPEGTTLDRINNDGNYEPKNCRWATKAEQHASQFHGGRYKKRIMG